MKNFYLFWWVGVLLVASLGTAAQSKVVVGSVSDYSNANPLVSASVLNVMSGKSVLSRKNGVFSLPAKKGDFLSFSAMGFYTDTLQVNDSLLQLKQVTIFLKPIEGTLPMVVVKGNYTPYQSDSIMRRKDFFKMVGETPPLKAIGKLNHGGFGVGVNLDYFKKRDTKKRRAFSLFELVEADAYVNYRWNEGVVNKYTGLTGDALLQFMDTHRPGWEWLRNHESEEYLLFYINQCLQKGR